MRGSTYTEEEELEKGRAKQTEERNVKFRGWDQSGIHFAYIEDYFYRVAYIKDQNNSTSIHEGPFSQINKVSSFVYMISSTNFLALKIVMVKS